MTPRDKEQLAAILGLVARSSSLDDGWGCVSAPIARLFKDVSGDWIEQKMVDGQLFVRLTPESRSVLKWMNQ